MSVDDLANPEHTFTRTELLAARNGNGETAPARTCDGCDADISDRLPSTRWCSTACAKRARRRNGNGTPPSVSESPRTELANGVGQSVVDVEHEADDLLELVHAIAREGNVVAVTFELKGGLCCTLARAGD